MTASRRMTVKVNLLLDPETGRLLTRLAENTENNKSQAIRQAIRIAAGVMLPPAEGGKVT